MLHYEGFNRLYLTSNARYTMYLEHQTMTIRYSIIN